MDNYFKASDILDKAIGTDAYFQIKSILLGTKTADVAPVRHGRWIKPVPGDGENCCSVCHAEQPWFYGYGYYEPDYCPSCGARMDKEDEHESD